MPDQYKPAPIEPRENSENELTIEKLRDLKYLPTRDELMRYFVIDDWNLRHDRWSEYTFGKEYNRTHVYEILNVEYINALSNYFNERADYFGATEENPLIVLEVGAGNGRLSYFLNQKLAGSKKIKIIPTDSGKVPYDISSLSVEKLDYKAALQKYNPKVVMCSWMPAEEDWTADFRAAQGVEEYFLIGEREGGCCGDQWRTWGFKMTKEDEEKYSGAVPPYKVDGFEKVYLPEMSDSQICSSDSPDPDSSIKGFLHSESVSFRRKKKIDNK